MDKKSYIVNLSRQIDSDGQIIRRKIKELRGNSELSDKDRTLIEVVDMLGGVREEGVDSFWEEVLKHCKKRVVDT